jgi:hypothetical protein
MTPLAAGQRWVPTRAGSRAKARVIRGVGQIDRTSGDYVSWGRIGEFRQETRITEFRAWIARHAAVLEQDGGGGGA